MGILGRVCDGLRVYLSTEHVIGRMSSCHLCLPSASVSLAHALIRWNGKTWELRDLGSTNGTYLNFARVTPGEPATLRTGNIVTFGDRHDRWEVLSDVAPLPAAVPLDGGEPRFLELGSIALPDNNGPLATIFVDGENWVIETDDNKLTLQPGAQFGVAGRQWRLDCPSASTSTFLDDQPQLAETTLVFEISRDEEHVFLTLRSPRGSTKLGERTSFYLAALLARQRRRDGAAALADCGWLDVDQVLRMVPDYSSVGALNVEIHRLRRLLAEAGVGNAMNVIERRRGQIRFGTDNFEVHSAVDVHPASAESL